MASQMDRSNPETQLYEDTHDLTKLEQITLQNVLDCLVRRYQSGHFYTFAGSVLISLNPCVKIKTENERKSIGISVNGSGNLIDFEDEPSKVEPPHVYSVGRKCLDNLYINGNNQIVVISGDSGAGKTTATQQLLCYFIEKNHERSTLKLSSPNLINLEKKVFCATLILEAMGNASTSSNPNSSRFGRLVQLNYKNISGVETIVGAQIQTCLLEKHRVSKLVPQRERNFHIFYYVLVAMRKGLFDTSCFLGPDCDPFTLIPHHFQESLRKADENDFDAFWQSILTLNMTSEMQSVFQIIYGIMMLLNIQFVSAANNQRRSGHKNQTSSSGSSEDSESDEKENRPMNEDLPSTCSKNVKSSSSSYSFFGQRNKGFAVAHAETLEPLEEIFEVDLYSILDALLARNITAGRRKSTVMKPCETIKECQQRLFALVNTIYDSLFTFILHRLNCLLQISEDQNHQHDQPTSLLLHTDLGLANTTKTLSLLDLYGFENLEPNNHLEQLLINYANERLQQVNISHLKSYMSQISTPSLASCKDPSEPREVNRVQQELSGRLHSLHSTIFTVLNEACMLNRPQAEDQVYSRLKESISNDNFIRVKKLQDQNCSFQVRHFATEVQYQLKGMVDKNRDYIPPEFIDILQSSSSPTLKSMFGSMVEVEDNLKGKNSNNKNKREKTVLQRFKTSVEKLIDILEVKNDENQDVLFIRCIRPNNDLIQGKIDQDLIKKQLYAIGIVDIIRISANGYPIRIPTVKFFKKFRTVLRCFSSNGSFEQERFQESFNFNKTQSLRFGATQVFLTEESFRLLLKLEESIWTRVVVKCQRTWRAIKRRKAEKEAEEQARRLIEEMLRVKNIKSPKIKHEDTEVDFYEDAVEFLATSTPAPDRVQKRRQYNHDSPGDLSQPTTSSAFDNDSLSKHRKLENFHETPTVLPPVESEQEPEKESISTPRITIRRKRPKLHLQTNDRPKSSHLNGSPSYSGPQGDSNTNQPCGGVTNFPSHLVFLDPHDPILFRSKQKLIDSHEQDKQLSSNENVEQQQQPLQLQKNLARRKSRIFDVKLLRASFSLQSHSSEKLFINEDRTIVSRRCIYKGPIRFYTKRTALANGHIVPLRLKAEGLPDILDGLRSN